VHCTPRTTSGRTEKNWNEPSRTEMAEKGGSAASAAGVVVNWADHKPKSVDFEDAMNERKCKEVWGKMLRDAGLPTAGEAQQRSFRLAVYVYACKNGTSREGDYKGKIQMSDGTTFDAAVIPRATGRMSIRKFFRGNMDESYRALKLSGVMLEDDRFVAKAAMSGIAADDAFATADWMTGCPLFTPSEAKSHEASFTYSIERAKRAREGKTLEGVERDRQDRELEAQGGMEQPEGRKVF